MGLQSHASGTDVTLFLRPPGGGLIIQCERYRKQKNVSVESGLTGSVLAKTSELSQLLLQLVVLTLKRGNSQLGFEGIHFTLLLSTFQLLIVTKKGLVCTETTVTWLGQCANEGNEVVPDLGNQGFIQLFQIAELVNELGVASDAERREFFICEGVAFESKLEQFA